MLHLDLGRPGSGLDFRQHLVDTISTRPDTPIRMRAGFAYVTRSGTSEVLNPLGSVPSWISTRKQWLVGVHHGITQPVAITVLGNLPNSEVRLATCGLPLRDSILGMKIFHAKTIAFDDGQTPGLLALMAGSANLTGAAIGNSSRNFEANITWAAPVDTQISSQFDIWWNEAWTASIEATSKNFDKYVKERERFLEQNPDVLIEASAHSLSDLIGAGKFWIEAGRMSTGGSHNAVDLNRDLAGFFGPPSRQRKQLTIVAGKKRWNNRPLSPKRTTLGVQLWRLSLPTLDMGGFDYKDQIICFTKKMLADETAYELDVADPESAKARRWRADAQRSGVLGRTGGGHNYAFI
jgi:uncharacterized protein YlzI (FlbEa/FlbD family)